MRSDVDTDNFGAIQWVSRGIDILMSVLGEFSVAISHSGAAGDCDVAAGHVGDFCR